MGKNCGNEECEHWTIKSGDYPGNCRKGIVELCNKFTEFKAQEEPVVNFQCSDGLCETLIDVDVYMIFKDGKAWCAIGPKFINLQESLAGFGDTKADALQELEKAEAHAETRRREGVRNWKCNNCMKEFRRGTPKDKAPCPTCKCGDQFTFEVFT